MTQPLGRLKLPLPVHPSNIIGFWEFPAAIISSFVLSYAQYASHVCHVDHSTQSRLGPASLVWIDPASVLMTQASILLAASVVSFAVRRQEQDKFQSLLFLLAVTAVVVVGLQLDVSPNNILLGLMPWSLSIAIGLSSITHWLIS
ncbi:hypothetical protein BDZ45DRAFT_92994 [Acephala macrosclerotiorum]|nr:hypothetical protein BDZ45DRAFT_92994 [Acephala macrosclerotiorum]